ncbi:MAG TPA: MerR family transcriptional regulator [Sediminispirochaeta sp.]|nr:MerR family transcriptional regulator [Sediminispirochaeta sp.]
MKESILTLDEAARLTELDEEAVLAWTKAGFLPPLGYTDEQRPFFAQEVVKKLEHLKHLQEIGYREDEIKKILRKVGWPESQETSARQAKEELLTVGSLAEQVGVSPRTIKHWEDKGILEADMRSEGGFRLYRTYYVFFCKLIQDLQLFGYSLEEIKQISDYFRLFDKIRRDQEEHSSEQTVSYLEEMLDEIERLYQKIDQLKSGISRWEELLKKHKKQIIQLKNRYTGK